MPHRCELERKRASGSSKLARRELARRLEPMMTSR
jgi:hypothetical protein